MQLRFAFVPTSDIGPGPLNFMKFFLRWLSSSQPFGSIKRQMATVRQRSEKDGTLG